jgi:hypothetical protein
MDLGDTGRVKEVIGTPLEIVRQRKIEGHLAGPVLGPLSEEGFPPLGGSGQGGQSEVPGKQ